MNKFLFISLFFIVFIGLSAYSFTDICCMFSAARHFGWPYPYVALHKTVETLAEARLVEASSVFELAAAGWQWSFSGHMTRSLLGSPILSLAGDMALSLIAAYTIAIGIRKIRPH